MTRIVLVPGTPLLLSRNSSLHDPVSELRAACHDAISWLGPTVLPLATREDRVIADELLGDRRDAHGGDVLAVGSGSACRSQRAPGHFTPDAEVFDESVARALTTADPDALVTLLRQSARVFGARFDVAHDLGSWLRGARCVSVDYDEAPFGVQYWVIRWVTDGGPIGA